MSQVLVLLGVLVWGWRTVFELKEWVGAVGGVRRYEMGGHAGNDLYVVIFRTLTS